MPFNSSDIFHPASTTYKVCDFPNQDLLDELRGFVTGRYTDEMLAEQRHAFELDQVLSRDPSFQKLAASYRNELRMLTGYPFTRALLRTYSAHPAKNSTNAHSDRKNIAGSPRVEQVASLSLLGNLKRFDIWKVPVTASLRSMNPYADMPSSPALVINDTGEEILPCLSTELSGSALVFIDELQQPTDTSGRICELLHSTFSDQVRVGLIARAYGS